MKTASISEAKNKLSALIDLVRAGETVLILDRGRPVARLEPALGDDNDRLARLERAGIVKRGSGKVSRRILEEPPPRVRGAMSGVDAVIEERRSGR